MMEQVYQVVVAEDESLARSNLVKKIEQSGMGFHVIGEAANGLAALEMVHDLLPDLVVTDIRMPMMDGLELIRNIFEQYPKMKCVIISGHSEFDYARQAIRYQVRDYLLKPVEAELLRETLYGIRTELDKETALRAQIVLNTAATGVTTEMLVQRLETWLRENFQQPISMDEISRQLGTDPSYLSKLFKKHRKESPLKYLISLRMNEARRLLASSPDLDVRAVAELVGFQDPFYFSRQFKQVCGKSPTEFREQSLSERRPPDEGTN